MSEDNEISHEIALPSGLIVAMREPNLSDIRVLSGRRTEAARKLSPKNLRDPMAQCFAGLTVEVIDPGPYTWDRCQVIKNGIVDWGGVLQADTSMAMLLIRKAMFTEEALGHDGNLFTFQVDCGMITCKLPIGWQVKISELEQSTLSPEAIERLREFGSNLTDLSTKGEPDPFVHIRLPKSGRLVRWKLMTRADQHSADLASKGDPDHLEEHGLLARLPYISGTADAKERLRFVSSLPWLDQELIRKTWKAHDAWVQDTIEIKCPHCGVKQKISIPIGDDFFSLSSVEPLATRWPQSEESSLISAISSSTEGDSAGAGMSA